MENRFLSVVIPVYNSENTLRACVQSILAQEEEGLEIILVDDGSADSSPALCDALMQDNPDVIRVIHQPNAGSLAARLSGTAAAAGEYLMYVDADDVLMDGALPRIRQDIRSKADLYLYDYLMDEVGGEKSNVVKLMDMACATEFSGTDKVRVSRAFMNGMMNTVCATAIRREFLQGLALRLPEQKLRHGEDRLMKLQMLAGAERIVYVPYAFYHYKWYPSSQGGDLRRGLFSAQIYKDFRVVWQIEQEHYAVLGFERQQCMEYDRKKLTRVCGLLETAWRQKSLSRTEVKQMVGLLSSDSMFCRLSEPELLAGTRPHVRASASLIRSNRPVSLVFYWQFCRMVRILRYSAEK